MVFYKSTPPTYESTAQAFTAFLLSVRERGVEKSIPCVQAMHYPFVRGRSYALSACTRSAYFDHLALVALYCAAVCRNELRRSLQNTERQIVQWTSQQYFTEFKATLEERIREVDERDEVRPIAELPS